MQPDGNTIVVDAPGGLIVVDTGRHAAHQRKIFDHAARLGKPVVAIFNTHWHLDHSGGNAELRARWPAAAIHTSTAIDGALSGFLAESRKDADAYLASGQASPQETADIRGDFAAMDDPGSLRPTHAVTRSGPVRIAGRDLVVNLASNAATEGDIWIVDPQSETLLAGDLVVAHVPYFDTACPEGWRKALDAIARTQFRTLIPGHGRPMGKAAFLVWRRAFNRLLDCAASTRPEATCIAGWKRDARAFQTRDHIDVDEALSYYFKTRLRANALERTRYCAPGVQ